MSGRFISGKIVPEKLKRGIYEVVVYSTDLDISGNFIFDPEIDPANLKEINYDKSFLTIGISDLRGIKDQVFLKWKVLQLNRNFPQSWIGAAQADNVNKSTFGVDLILPLDDYQKSMRSAKYAVMTIALTFLIFFLIEIINRRKIHPFQYALVGLALCLFYILLVSISEHSNFIPAYTLSAAGIIIMISLYSISVFRLKKLSILLFLILSGIYGFIFVTLQLTDYALLIGSIGLTLILAATMYFTRNINWYELNKEPD